VSIRRKACFIYLGTESTTTPPILERGCWGWAVGWLMGGGREGGGCDCVLGGVLGGVAGGCLRLISQVV